MKNNKIIAGAGIETNSHLRVKKKNRGTVPVSQYIGVRWSKRDAKWEAYFSYTSKLEGRQTRKYLGQFENERDAAKAYDKMALAFGLPTNILKPIGTDIVKNDEK